jgi:parvulin-like peptidyl-prolyl isomerase
MVQRGRELGIRFSDENFKNALENVKKQNNLDDEGLKKALIQAGLTLAELRQNFERTYLMNGVTQMEIMANMRLTEEEARQYYEKHPEFFMKPATLVLREIVVNVPTRTDALGQPATNVAEDEEAKERISKARARVLAGEEFAKVAGEVSDAGSKANGGLVGAVVIDEMVPSLRETLSKLKQGDVSEPLRFPAGYRIYMVESRTIAQVQPFDEVREAIAQKIYQGRAVGETKKYLERLRAQALIEWKDDGYKQMYEKALVSQGKM